MLSDPPRGYGGRSRRSVTARKTLPCSGGGARGGVIATPSLSQNSVDLS